MRKFVGFLLFIASAFAWGADYHVCSCATGADGDCVAGNDSTGNGSSGTPWQSYEKARTTFIAGGNNVYFCRGGAWEVSATGASWDVNRGGATSFLTIGEYVPGWASGNEGQPAIKYTGAITNHNQGVFTIANATTQYIRIQDLALLGDSAQDYVGYGVNVPVASAGIELLRMDISHFFAGVRTYGVGQVHLKKSYIHNNSNYGYTGVVRGLSETDRVLIQRNKFENNGHDSTDTDEAVTVHLEFSKGDSTNFANGGAYVTVEGNTFVDASLDGSGVCQGRSIQLHGWWDDVSIKDNVSIVPEAGAYCGFVYARSRSEGITEGLRGIHLLRNTVVNFGNYGIILNTCADCSVSATRLFHRDAGASVIEAISDSASPQGYTADDISDQTFYHNNYIRLLADANDSIGYSLTGENNNFTQNTIDFADNDSGDICWQVVNATVDTQNRCFKNAGIFIPDEGQGDNDPPIRSNGAPSGTLSSSTTQTAITLLTNEVATCKYGTSNVSYDSLPTTFSLTDDVAHSTLVTGLSDGGSYTYYVRCEDVAGNQNTTGYAISFSVDATGGGQDPTVLFEQDFEDLSPGLMSDSSYDNAFPGHQWGPIEGDGLPYIVTGSEAYNNGKSARVRCSTGNDWYWGDRFPLPGEHTTLWLSHRVKHELNPQNTTTQNGKRGGLCGTGCPSGGNNSSNSWSSRYHTGGNSATHHYTYRHNDNASGVGYFMRDGCSGNGGNSSGANPVAYNTAGNWSYVKTKWTLNTPGSSNGSIDTWVNGSKAATCTGISFRNRSSDHIDKVQWEIFLSGGTGNCIGNGSDDIYFDDLKVTTGDPDVVVGPPIRSNASPSGELDYGTPTTTISLDTNENATCKWGTSQGVNYNSINNTFSTTGTTNHSQQITLTGPGNYIIYTRCQNELGVHNTDDYVISFSVSDVIFSVDFDSNSDGTYSCSERDDDWGNDTIWDIGCDESTLTIVSGSEAYSGKSLKATCFDRDPPNDSMTYAMWNKQLGNFDTLWLSFRIKHNANPAQSAQTGKRLALAESQYPSANTWNGYFHTGGQSTHYYLPDLIEGSTGQHWRGNNCDESGPNPQNIGPAGEWVYVKTKVTVNSIGNSDGSIDTWKNGVKVQECRGLKFRNTAAQGVGTLCFENFLSGPGTCVGGDSDAIFWDDIKVSLTDPDV